MPHVLSAPPPSDSSASHEQLAHGTCQRGAVDPYLTSHPVCLQGVAHEEQKATGLKGCDAPSRRRTLEGFIHGRNLADMAPTSVGDDTPTGAEWAAAKRRTLGELPSMASGPLASVRPPSPSSPGPQHRVYLHSTTNIAVITLLVSMAYPFACAYILCTPMTSRAVLLVPV